jgi:DNA-binding transcriptional LysR family regulator
MESIPIHLLHAFVTFNDSPNIQQAAGNLGITQPALSKQLKALETLLPHAIFSFRGRKKVLTPYGQSLHVRIRERIGNLQATIQDVTTMHSDPSSAHLRISARLGILDRLAENIEFSGCLTFNETTNDQVVRDLLSREAEIGIAHSLPETHELIAKPLFKEEFQILIPKKLLRVRKHYGKSLFEELKDLPCIDFKKDDLIIRTVCTANGVDPRTLQVSRITPNYNRIAKLVDLNLGWAIIPTYLRANESRSWVIRVPIEVIQLRKFYIAYRTEFSAIPWFANVVKQIAEGCRNQSS